MLGIAVVGVGALGTIAAAQDDDDTFYACVRNERVLSWSIRLNDEPECPRRATLVSWNEDGLPGPAGDQGPAGADGADGAVGPVGPAGADGAAGPAGADGADGAVGPVGPAGADGVAGPAGADGADGAVGPVGPAGADGVAGPAGADGADGAVGPAGPAGGAAAPGCFADLDPQSTDQNNPPPASLVACGNGTFTDQRTGLIWMSDAGCSELAARGSHAAARTAVAGLAHGMCGLSDNSSAGAWRLPTRQEFEALLPCQPGVECFNAAVGHVVTNAPPATIRVFNTSTIDGLVFFFYDGDTGQSSVRARTKPTEINWAVRDR